MSASVYGNPYIYKPPPPRIDYPELFHCFRKLTCRYVLDSKFLALAVLILGVTTFLIMVVCLNPFWFELSLDPIQGTFGTEPVKRHVTISTGLFYMREDHFDNTVFLDKYSNTDTVPSVIQAAQAFFIAGTCVLVGCLGAGVILMFRRFSSVTALIVLAGATTLSAACQIFVILLCAALILESSCDPYDSGNSCNYNDNLEWNLIPIYSQVYRVEPHLTPYVKPDWAFYIAILGAIVNCAAAVMVWLETYMTSKNLRDIRYQQLKEHRDPYEKESDPYTGMKFRYQPPTQPGPNIYGMQPVFVSDRPYEGMVISEPGGYNPSESFAPRLRPPSPGFGHRYGPTSSTSSVSGPIVSREIDL
ncbi:hypothetical protein PoB_003858700 [Plakobranchus ocellatus]|uniref:Uncharacterized protein n=1 Tax=Plakobranchus ocellatus TaxID=259542 RepID=A0AAV4AXS0_9GAST|nr:hypothetical protein PoB_003858700 [Plakobranchus ocellatus]